VLEEINGEAWETVRAAIELAERDRYKYRLRGPYLARMELLMREAKTEELRDDVVDYYANFSSKTICANDLRPFVVYLVKNGEDDDMFDKLKFVAEADGSVTAHIMLCWLFLWVSRLEITVEELLQRHRKENSKPTDKRIDCGDYLTIACHVLLPFHKGFARYADRQALVQAVMLLEYCLARHPHNYHCNLLLVILYMEIGYTERGFVVWCALDV